MKIYVGHSTAFNYEELLYQPLKKSSLWQCHDFILPHEFQKTPVHSKNIISKADLVIAEVSYPSTGVGIELGWADFMNCKILCLYQKNSQPSSSISLITAQFIQYEYSQDLIDSLNLWLKKFDF